jgi:hypothetical protein
MTRLSADEAVRLRSWAAEIAETLLPPGVRKWIDGHDVRFAGGLAIHRRKGCWWDYAVGIGGWSTVKQIAHQKHCDVHEADIWAKAWLVSPDHAGLGSCAGATDDADDDEDGVAIPASKAAAEQILGRLENLAGTPGYAYLSGRKILPPFPDNLKYVGNARAGEGAVVALLSSYAHQRVVGVHLVYIDPSGSKTTLRRDRDRFMLERVKDAVFVIPPGSPTPDPTCELAIAEGVEDALSLSGLRCGFTTLASCGIGTLGRRRGQKSPCAGTTTRRTTPPPRRCAPGSTA